MKKSFESASDLDGYGDLTPEDAAKIDKAWEDGRVADEDIPESARKPDDGEKPKTKKAASKKVRGILIISMGGNVIDVLLIVNRRTKMMRTKTMRRNRRRKQRKNLGPRYETVVLQFHPLSNVQLQKDDEDGGEEEKPKKKSRAKVWICPTHETMSSLSNIQLQKATTDNEDGDEEEKPKKKSRAKVWNGRSCVNVSDVRL